MAEKAFEAGEIWISEGGARWSVVCVHKDGHLKGWATLSCAGVHISKRQNDTTFWRKAKST